MEGSLSGQKQLLLSLFMVLEASMQTMVRWLAFCKRHHMEVCGHISLQKLRTQDICIFMVGMASAANTAGKPNGFSWFAQFSAAIAHEEIKLSSLKSRMKLIEMMRRMPDPQ